MSLTQPQLDPAFRRSVREHWRAFLIEGIVLVILGIAAIALPPLAGLAIALILGWLFLLGGVVGLTHRRMSDAGRAVPDLSDGVHRAVQQRAHHRVAIRLGHGAVADD